MSMIGMCNRKVEMDDEDLNALLPKLRRILQGETFPCIYIRKHHVIHPFDTVLRITERSVRIVALGVDDEYQRVVLLVKQRKRKDLLTKVK